MTITTNSKLGESSALPSTSHAMGFLKATLRFSPLADWSAVRQLRLGADQTLGGKPARKVGTKWQGSPPEFRNLRWIAES